jgi:hypothetical protein
MTCRLWTDVANLAHQRRRQCTGKHLKRRFSIKLGTMFEDFAISLSKWFTNIRRMST